MKKPFLKSFLRLSILMVIIPFIIMIIWSVSVRWPWPSILPDSLSLRSLKELLWGSHQLIPLLLSSILLSTLVGVLSTVISLMASRAIEVDQIPGARFFRFFSLLIFVVPATAFTMGIHYYMIRGGLSDTYLGVVLAHVVMSIPYSMNILLDLTKRVGKRLEEQAVVLGEHPVKAFFSTSFKELIPGMLSSFSMAFIVSYSQYFMTLIIGGGRVKTLALVLVPYIQEGDRSLASAFATAFVGSGILVVMLVELIMKKGDVHGTRGS